MANDAVKGIIFDFNGTMMYDSPIHEAVWKDFIPEHGGVLGSPEEYAKHIFGCSNRYILTHYLKDLTEADIDRLTFEKEAEYRRRCALDKNVYRLVDGLVECLNAMKATGLPMTIATGSERLNVEFYFNSPNLGLERWFDFSKVVYDDFTFPGKPEPDVYLRAADKIGVSCSDCIVFEDSFSGVKSARRAGAKYVVALGIGATKEKFRDAGGVDMAVEDFCNYRSFPGLNLV